MTQDKIDKSAWRTQTRLVHEGMERSQFGETAEALYLTSGYVYDSAEQAEARFKEEEEGDYIYSRFGNPTVRAFETRMMALEQAEDARATATGMAAVTACLMSQLEAGDHIVAARALFGSCRYVVETLLPRFQDDHADLAFGLELVLDCLVEDLLCRIEDERLNLSFFGPDL